jgi:hypothetical protein
MFELINRRKGTEISRKLSLPTIVFVDEGEKESCA